MQLRDLYLQGKNKIKEAGFEAPGLEASTLLSRALDIDSFEIYTDPEREISPEKAEIYQYFLERRMDSEPNSYIIGFKEFYSKSFEVSPSVLIPRPETELLVEEALNLIPKKGSFIIADIGTGSGCIGVTLSALRENIAVIATDASSVALKTAKHNSFLNKVSDKISFIEVDLLTCFKENSFDIVVSNPPYISVYDYANLQKEIIDFEPKIALVSGKDGLVHIRRVVSDSRTALKTGGWCLLEVGVGQSTCVKVLLDQAGFTNISSTTDLNGVERVVKAQWKK